MVRLTFQVDELLRRLGSAGTTRAQDDVLYELESLPVEKRVEAIELGFREPGSYAAGAQVLLISNLVSLAHDVLTETRVDAETVERLMRASIMLIETWGVSAEKDPDLLYMFWDRLLFSTWAKGLALREHGEVIASALEQLLYSSDYDCIRSAIHGFNHMPAGLRAGPLERFIERTGDESLRDFATRALAGGLQ